MLTDVTETAAALSAVEEGAHGYIHKDGNFPAMLEKIREVFDVRLEPRSRALLRRVPADAEKPCRGAR
jgi:DNA-binding NarL/FixJ family response regulator